MKCVRKEQFECVQFTKENRDEILRTLEPCLNGKIFLLNMMMIYVVQLKN